MKREIIASPDAPAAIGPYSQAVVVRAEAMVWCSGQIALDTDGTVVGGGDVRAQTRQVLGNLGAVLDAAGSGFAKVVRCTIYLVDMADYGAVNEVYAEFFTTAPPARAAVAVAALPRGARVEISCVATGS